mgnify:CR=1 FL=1
MLNAFSIMHRKSFFKKYYNKGEIIIMNESKRKRIFTLQWHITDACDQRCKHCYIFRGEDKKKLSKFDKKTMKAVAYDFIHTCELMDCRPYFTITGGDPLLFSNIWELLELIHENNAQFAILGNPFHLNSEVISRLEDLGCTFYQMSLDGLKETHDAIRKKGSFDATIESMKYFQSSKIRLAIMSTVSKLNFNELPELVDIIVKNGANSYGFARFCPMENDYSQMVSPEEYKEFLDKMWKKFTYYKDSNTRFVLKDHLWKLYLYEKGIFNPCKLHNPDNLILDGCHCGISHLTCLSNGTVYACRRSETPIGTVPEQSFYDIFNGATLEQYRQYDRFEACSKCELKNFCRGCPSVTKSLTGNFYAKDPQCWKTI